jgi:hypothetical protein
LASVVPISPDYLRVARIGLPSLSMAGVDEKSASASVTGSAGADLFFIDTGDKITDFQFGNKDGDFVFINGVQVSWPNVSVS